MSGRHRKPPRRGPGRHRRPPGPAHWLAPGLVVVALLGAGGVGAHAALTDSSSGAPVSVAPTAPSAGTPSAGTPAATPSAAPGGAAGSAAPSASPAPSPVAHRSPPALRLVVSGSVSWIEVRRPSGRVLVSGIVRPGHRLVYRRGPLSVVIGNAGAVRVSRNGHTHLAGRPGQVVTLTIPR